MLRNGHAHTDTHNVPLYDYLTLTLIFIDKWRAEMAAKLDGQQLSTGSLPRRTGPSWTGRPRIFWSNQLLQTVPRRSLWIPVLPIQQTYISYLLSRHVILPKEIAKYVPADTLLSEEEWRMLGVTQSPGWVHYMIHAPEPHIPIFRRPWDGSA